MNGFIIYTTYRMYSNKPQVLLFGRLENGESFVTINDHSPCFWIRHSDRKLADEILKDINTENVLLSDTSCKNFSMERMTKVTLHDPKEIKDLRKIFSDKGIIGFEADLRLPFSFLIDKDIKSCMKITGEYHKPSDSEALFVDRIYINPELNPSDHTPSLNVLSVDIETDPNASRILSISLYSDKVQKVLIHKEGQFENADTFRSEKDMLESFKRIILALDPDIITGWNFIDFDLKVLKERFAQHHIPFVLGRTSSECTIRLMDSYFIASSANFQGRAVIDGIHLMKISFIKLDDYKLNTAAIRFLGEEKLITSEDRGQEIMECYENDPQKLIDYNLKDSELVFNILIKSKALELSIKRSIITGMAIDRVHASIASLDSLYIRELKKQKIIAPSSFITDSEERIQGGFVMESAPGIYTGIIILDFKSLYPSVIRTFNIDPFSFVPHDQYLKLPEPEQNSLIESPNKAHFRDEEGILPKILVDLWTQRDLAKQSNDQLTSQAIKILMNSFFGVLANPNCRFYSLEVANAITHFGQFLNKLTIEKVKEKGYDVIYGDTDSIFVNTDTDNINSAKRMGKELEEHINGFYKKYISDNYKRTSYLEIEFEKVFKKFLMPTVRGSETGAKKRYAGLIVKDGKEQLTFTGLEFVRRDWTALAKQFQLELLDNIFHNKPVDDYIRKFVTELKEGKKDNLLVYKKAIRKGVSEYTKTTPPHIKAARKLGRELPGLITYVVTTNGPEPTEKQESKLDYDHYIEKQVKPIADSILSFLDKNFDDLVAKQKQTDLSNF